MAKKYYAVRSGKKPGIYTTFEDCQRQVLQVKGSEYKGFNSLAEAEAYLGINNNNQSQNKQKERPKIAQYTIYTDGGCAVNPGGPGGIGVVIIDNTTGAVHEHSEGYQCTTNNRMEMRAVLYALTILPAGTSADLYSDSQYVIKCMSGEWQKQKNTDLWEKISKAAKGKMVSLHWVKGHAGNQYNELCDRLASQGIAVADKIDEGYAPAEDPNREFRNAGKKLSQQSEKARNLSSMEKNIGIPDGFPKRDLEGLLTHEFMEKMHVSELCARLLSDFLLEERHGFKSYMSLKTGGIDFWSRKSVNDMIAISENGQMIWELIQKNTEDIKQASSAMKWFCRGLPVKDAIRKTYVDREVEANAKNRSGY